MSEIIRDFYKKNGFPEKLIEQKVKSFCKHPDIAEEFEEWIQTGAFREKDAVMVEGHTAKSLSKMSGFLDGDGAFSLLIELKDGPTIAKRKIEEGFKWK